MKHLGDLELSESQIIYPSPDNPRLRGLSAEEGSIKTLAESIAKDGQLQRIIVRKVGEKYETIDGDRRCVAVFKVLGWKTIKASAYELTDRETLRLRITANIQKEELGTVEKGNYCFQLFKLLAEEDSLNVNDAWANIHVRSKYLAEISSEIGVSPTTIVKWIYLWRNYPVEAQRFIARNKEDLRRGLIPPTLALEIVSVAKRADMDVNKVLEIAIKQRWRLPESRHVSKMLSKGINITIDELPELIQKFRHGTIRKNLVLQREPCQRLSFFGHTYGINFSRLLDFAIRFVLNHSDSFKKYLADELTKRRKR